MSFLVPKKPQILYAPMLSSFGGGSARGFNPGGGIGGIPINQTYNATNTEGRTGTIQSVQAAGTYTIQVVGAQPPQQTYQTPGYQGGSPAHLSGTFTFAQEVTLQLLVGQKPARQNFNGGGGGSFVAVGSSYATALPLIVAGGGGSMRCGNCGGQFGSLGGSFSDLDASFPTSIGQSNGKNSTYANGGTNGNGGADGQSAEGQAGAGFYTDASPGGSTDIEALSFRNGGVGGLYDSTGAGEGGFGGGGGGGWGGSGAGGGYNGGGAGSNCTANAAGGGGSFITSSYSSVLNHSSLYTALRQVGGHNGFIIISGGT